MCTRGLGSGGTAITASWSEWEPALEPPEGGINSPQHSRGERREEQVQRPSCWKREYSGTRSGGRWGVASLQRVRGSYWGEQQGLSAMAWKLGLPEGW